MLEQDARCKDCDYPLKGLPSGECPECGRAFDWNKRSTYKLGDEPGPVRTFFILRRRAIFRLGLVFAPGLLVFGLIASGLIQWDWGCCLILIYPVWVLVGTISVLAFCSPTGLLSTGGAILLGIVIAMVFYFFAGLWGMALAVPTGLVGGLVFKHMELNDLL